MLSLWPCSFLLAAGNDNCVCYCQYACVGFVLHNETICLTRVGVRGTYQGLTATVLKQGTNQAIRFYVMNLLRNWYKGAKAFTLKKLNQMSLS